jgi:hypothetical protein
MIFNVLTLLHWTTWLAICIALILIFWLIWGGKEEYEFVGVRPLQSPDIAEIFQKEIPETMLQNPEAIFIEKELKSSKGEEIVADVLEEFLQKKVERNIRPSFLRNPETGKFLEIDCYDPEYRIAVEYNGIQHYVFPSAFHKSEKEFHDQLYRDRLKKKLCEENDVYLIPVPYWVDTCVPDPDDPDGEMICNPNTSRSLRYARIYDFVKAQLKKYFSIIMPSDKIKQGEIEIKEYVPEYDSDRWVTDSEEYE